MPGTGRTWTRRLAAWIIGLAIAGVLGTGVATAAAGDLDPTFSGDGKVALPSIGSFVPRAMALQPDGRIVVAGASCEPDPISQDGTCLADGASSFRIARLTPDGGLDPEFGDKGLVTTPVGSGRSQALDVLVLPSGAILAAGAARDADGNDVLALARYDARGALDLSFGTGGISLQRVGTTFSAIADIAPGPGTTIYAAGQAESRMMLARFLDTGQLDPTFGDAGVVIGGPLYGYGLGVVPTADGGALGAGIAGDSSDPATFRFGELKLTAGGAADGGFGSGGLAEQRMGNPSSFANAATATADGGWVAAGAGTMPDTGLPAMAAVRGPAGNGFVPTWKSLSTAGQGAIANDVAALLDGRTILAGQVTPDAGGLDFAVVRLTTEGKLDSGFAGNGFSTIHWDTFPWARSTAVAVQPDGRVLTAGLGCAGGSGTTRCTSGTSVLLLARQIADPAVAPVPTPTPTPTPPTPDTTKPKGKLSRVPSKVRRTTLRRKGIPVRVTATEKVRLELVLTGTRVGTRSRTITLARVKLRTPRLVASFRVRPPKKTLKRVKDGRLRVEVRIADRAGNAVTLRKHVQLR